jgi:uncharacterized protein DUF3810
VEPVPSNPPDSAELAPDEPPPKAGRRWLGLATILALPLHGALLWASRGSPEGVEAVYGGWVFPAVSWVQRLLDSLASPLSPALTILVLLVAGVAWRARRDERSLRSFCWRMLVATALVGHLFPLCWGWCYWRPPVLERQAISTEEPKRAELEATAALLGRAVNKAWLEWPTDPDWDDLDRRVDAAVLTFLEQEGLDEAAHPSRIRFLPSGVMFVGGWTGVTIPWTTEGWVDPAVDPRILPVCIAHEKAHQAGFARESDANLIAFLALLRSPDPDLRYAALFDLAPVFGAEVEIPVVLAPAVKQDLVQAVAREEEVKVEVVQETTTAVYDSYLKANAVEPGVDDYDAVALRVQAWLRARPEDWARLEAIAQGD